MEAIDVVLPSKELQAAIAVNRFGLGARPGDLDAARGDPRGYLIGQIEGSALIPTGLDESSAQRVIEYRDFVAQRRAAQQTGDPNTPALLMARRDLRQDANGDFLARAQLGADTPDGFRERWALFFANHFTVSGINEPVATLVAPFEQEAIRPHVFGRFEDMLVASSSHPGMLLYLDQAQSTGPDSPVAQKAKGRPPGLNENLAREIMELHSLGVDAGYTQADVTEFARAMTGWSIARDKEPEGEGAFKFRPQNHEPGARTIMGRRYPEGGVEQARAAMKDFAASPHTAQHLARKIGQHFVADDPPPALTARLQKAYLKSDGRLDVVARTLINSPEAWDPQPRKFKTPYEFMLSSWRATGQRPQNFQRLGPPLNGLGQNPAGAPSPKGWPDVAGDWSAPDALIKRMTWSQGFAAQVAGSTDPNHTAQQALGAQLTPAVATAVSRAESRPEAVALLLMSPEFQRR